MFAGLVLTWVYLSFFIFRDENQMDGERKVHVLFTRSLDPRRLGPQVRGLYDLTRLLEGKIEEKDKRPYWMREGKIRELLYADDIFHRVQVSIFWTVSIKCWHYRMNSCYPGDSVL
jgi:hypothetical protein